MHNFLIFFILFISIPLYANEDTLLDILENRERLEALLEKTKNSFDFVDACPKKIYLYQGRGTKDEVKYFEYSTRILMDLMAKEFNKKRHHDTVINLTELRVEATIDRNGVLENLYLREAHPYGVIRNSGDYAGVQEIFNQIHYDFKGTMLKDECEKYVMLFTAQWNM